MAPLVESSAMTSSPCLLRAAVERCCAGVSDSLGGASGRLVGIEPPALNECERVELRVAERGGRDVLRSASESMCERKTRNEKPAR